jgi:choline dehydrogenase-like flavoprotein
VVDPRGRVHGLANLFVADGSVLPRSSRVNPALSIYAWGLRVAALLDGRDAPIRDDQARRPPQEVMA